MWRGGASTAIRGPMRLKMKEEREGETEMSATLMLLTHIEQRIKKSKGSKNHIDTTIQAHIEQRNEKKKSKGSESHIEQRNEKRRREQIQHKRLKRQRSESNSQTRWPLLTVP